jgi:hypothetical protein
VRIRGRNTLPPSVALRPPSSAAALRLRGRPACQVREERLGWAPPHCDGARQRPASEPRAGGPAAGRLTVRAARAARGPRAFLGGRWAGPAARRPTAGPASARRCAKWRPRTRSGSLRARRARGTGFERGVGGANLCSSEFQRSATDQIAVTRIGSPAATADLTAGSDRIRGLFVGCV